MTRRTKSASTCWPRSGKIPGGRCLDIGCGQGHTTRLLAEVLEPAERIGLDYDTKLVAYAAEQAGNGAGIRFVQGDAMQLECPDASFDLVFTRYLLIHMADPMVVIRENRIAASISAIQMVGQWSG